MLIQLWESYRSENYTVQTYRIHIPIKFAPISFSIHTILKAEKAEQTINRLSYFPPFFLGASQHNSAVIYV